MTYIIYTRDAMAYICMPHVYCMYDICMSYNVCMSYACHMYVIRMP